MQTLCYGKLKSHMASITLLQVESYEVSNMKQIRSIVAYSSVESLCEPYVNSPERVVFGIGYMVPCLCETIARTWLILTIHCAWWYNWMTTLAFSSRVGVCGLVCAEGTEGFHTQCLPSAVQRLPGAGWCGDWLRLCRPALRLLRRPEQRLCCLPCVSSLHRPQSVCDSTLLLPLWWGHRLRPGEAGVCRPWWRPSLLPSSCKCTYRQHLLWTHRH